MSYRRIIVPWVANKSLFIGNWKVKNVFIAYEYGNARPLRSVLCGNIKSRLPHTSRRGRDIRSAVLRSHLVLIELARRRSGFG